jgi:hypothetical protein
MNRELGSLSEATMRPNSVQEGVLAFTEKRPAVWTGR